MDICKYKMIFGNGFNLFIILKDLDGTLLDKKSQVSEKTKTVFQKVFEKYPDLHFVIATGRTMPMIEKVRQDLNLIERPNTEYLLSNGCILYHSDGRVLWQSALSTDYLEKFHKLFEDHPKGVYFYASGDDLVTFDKKWSEFTKEQARKEGKEYKAPDKEKFLKDIMTGERIVNKVSYFSFKGPEEEEIKKELDKLREEFGLEYCQSTPFFVEYMPPETNKGTGLTRLLERLNLQKDEVLAFGDGGNDLELLQEAGWPVAMANACEELKPFAKLTAKPNTEDGVADMLERIFLKEELLN